MLTSQVVYKDPISAEQEEPLYPLKSTVLPPGSERASTATSNPGKREQFVLEPARLERSQSMAEISRQLPAFPQLDVAGIHRLLTAGSNSVPTSQPAAQKHRYAYILKSEEPHLSD